jgi:hypothetical protein
MEELHEIFALSLGISADLPVDGRWLTGCRGDITPVARL